MLAGIWTRAAAIPLRQLLHHFEKHPQNSVMLTGYGIAGSVAACLTLRLIEEGGEQFLSRIRCISFGQVMIDSAAFNIPSLPFTPSCPSKMSDQNWARGSEVLGTWRRRGFSSELPRATRSRRNLGYFSSQSAVLVELRRCNPKGKKLATLPRSLILKSSQTM